MCSHEISDVLTLTNLVVVTWLIVTYYGLADHA